MEEVARPPPTDPPAKDAVALTGEVTFVSKTGVPVLASAVTPSDELVVPCTAKGTTCTATTTLVCGAQSQAGTVKNVTVTTVQFSHSADWTAGTCTASVTASATGMTSATKDFTFTVTAPKVAIARYTDKVYATWSGAQLYSVTKSGLKLLTNKTSFTIGGYPFFNCWQPKGKTGTLADGTILVTCQDAVNLRRHYLYIDPISEELHEYSGPVPATLACTENTDKTWACPGNHDWVSVQSDLPRVTGPLESVNAVQVAEGWFFVTAYDGRNTRFLSAADNTVTVVQQSVPGDGTVSLFQSFSN